MAPVMALVTCAALFALQHTTHALPAHQQVNHDLINSPVIHQSPVPVSTEPTSASSWNQDSDAYWRLDSTDQILPDQLKDLDIDLQELESLFAGWAEYAVELWSSKDKVTDDELARLDESSGLGDRKLWQRNDKRAPQCGGPTSPRIEARRKERERLMKNKVNLRKEEVEAKSIEDKEERESKLKAIEAEMKQVDEDLENLRWPGRPWGPIKQPQCMDKRALADVGGPKDPKLAELKTEYSRLVRKQADILKERVKATFIKNNQKKQERRDALTAGKKQVDEQIKKVKEEIKLEKKGGH